MAKQPVTKKEKPAAVKQPQKQATPALPFVFDRTNYIMMIAGVMVILIGFLLMSGGATQDPNVFPKEEIYSFRRITLAPIVVMLGFAIEIFAILKRPNIE
ncbi:MAG: DUF3098 domain-containing protein [Chitinophagales bacterium]|nr:DUF3098 domain-containing protein [Chitinophagales bacterium]MDW8419401.1 DUF3098 domain-containing protein [Chitinophagales bacterium]